MKPFQHLSCFTSHFIWLVCKFMDLNSEVVISWLLLIISNNYWSLVVFSHLHCQIPRIVWWLFYWPKQRNCVKSGTWRDWETLLINFFSLGCCSFAAHSGIPLIATVQVNQLCYSFAEFSLLVLSGSQAFLV